MIQSPDILSAVSTSTNPRGEARLSTVRSRVSASRRCYLSDPYFLSCASPSNREMVETTIRSRPRTEVVVAQRLFFGKMVRGKVIKGALLPRTLRSV